jgi:hypothetical protein
VIAARASANELGMKNCSAVPMTLPVPTTLPVRTDEVIE